MVFEFVPEPGFSFLHAFAQQFDVPIEGDRLQIPARMGEGYIRSIDLSPDIKLIVHRYQLKEEFILRRMSSPVATQLISIIFNLNEEPTPLSAHNQLITFSRQSEYAIQIASTDLDSEIRFPANREVYFTVIGMLTPALKNLLQIKEPNGVVQTILSAAPSYLFYERMTADMQKSLKQLIDYPPEGAFSSLYYRIKVQELFFYLFEKLQQRESLLHSPVLKADVEKLLLIRSVVLADLSQPPSLPQLARMVGLSETKMKNLFRQVFGDSIYNHFQKARMEEAAFLLKHMGQSVSDTGYQLGFSNMSHFSRLFEKHHGVKPKKYALGG